MIYILFLNDKRLYDFVFLIRCLYHVSYAHCVCVYYKLTAKVFLYETIFGLYGTDNEDKSLNIPHLILTAEGKSLK